MESFRKKEAGRWELSEWTGSAEAELVGVSVGLDEVYSGVELLEG